jgi:hypothetical protein
VQARDLGAGTAHSLALWAQAAAQGAKGDGGGGGGEDDDEGEESGGTIDALTTDTPAAALAALRASLGIAPRRAGAGVADGLGSGPGGANPAGGVTVSLAADASLTR